MGTTSVGAQRGPGAFFLVARYGILCFESVNATAPRLLEKLACILLTGPGEKREESSEAMVDRLRTNGEHKVTESQRESIGLKLAEEALQRRLRTEKLITGISTSFIKLTRDQIDTGINRALREIGEFTGIDRSYLFLFSEDGTKTDNTHEWCAKGMFH